MARVRRESACWKHGVAERRCAGAAACRPRFVGVGAFAAASRTVARAERRGLQLRHWCPCCVSRAAASAAGMDRFPSAEALSAHPLGRGLGGDSPSCRSGLLGSCRPMGSMGCLAGRRFGARPAAARLGVPRRARVAGSGGTRCVGCGADGRGCGAGGRRRTLARRSGGRLGGNRRCGGRGLGPRAAGQGRRSPRCLARDIAGLRWCGRSSMGSIRGRSRSLCSGRICRRSVPARGGRPHPRPGGPRATGDAGGGRAADRGALVGTRLTSCPPGRSTMLPGGSA